MRTKRIMYLLVLVLLVASFTASATEIEEVRWDSGMEVIEILLGAFPASWDNWRMYVNGVEIPIEGGVGKPVVRPNAPLNERPTGLFVGTEPWITGLAKVDFPCMGTIQFFVPGEGHTNIFSYDLRLDGCSTAVYTSSVSAKGGVLRRDEIWSGQIHVTETVIVPKGITLTIEPSTTVQFRHYRGYREPWRKVGLIITGGTIKAIGTPSQQIWFTSDAEDPINGDWQGISVLDSSNSEFRYAIVEFAELGIEQFASSVPITDSVIRWNNTEGLYAERSQPLFERNTFYGNGYHAIALEQYNNVRILNNVFRDGNWAIHCEETTTHIEGNYFYNERIFGITAGMESNLVVKRNRFERIAHHEPIRVGADCSLVTEGNDFGDGDITIPQFDYPVTASSTLDYIPGDPEDRYLYIYDAVDETRRVVKRLGQGLGFGWSLVYAHDKLWRFSIGHGEVGLALDLIEIDPVTEDFRRYGNNVIINPRGLTFDGEYFWVNDFSLLKIFKFTLKGNWIKILDSFDIPEIEKGGTMGLTTDGSFLYLRSRDGSKLYVLDKKGNLTDEIHFLHDIGNAIVWTGKHFWTSYGCGKGLCKYNKAGTLLGEIYPVAEGTWALAWDGASLWTIQRTCENWQDPKIYQIEVLDDSLD